MAVMTIAARGGVFVTLGQREPMNTGAVAFGLLLVTGRTTRRLDRKVIVGMFGGDVSVAAGAGVGLMNGGREPGLVHKQGDLPAGSVCLGKRLVGMALEAGAVFERCGRRRAKDYGERDKKC